MIFLAGIASFLSPCVLPLVPAYVSYMAGESVAGDERVPPAKWPAWVLSVFFAFGFSVVFITLGASASVLGQVLLEYRWETNLIGGAVIVLFGLFMTGMLRSPWLERDLRIHVSLDMGRPWPAFILGLAFGFGWTPCIGPILGAILTASAVTATLSQGVMLLGVYALGLSLPFLAAAAFAQALLKRLRDLRRIGRIVHLVAGVTLIVTGIAIMTGYLSAFGFWLLRTFPVFSALG
jgi:cytochrome c-type biogenesis protein